MTDFSAHLEEALGHAYQLERELVGGGMSRVFVARERSLGRLVVVKVLPPELAAGVNRERFRREIHVAAQLQHPHIVPLLSAGEHGDLLWYTMPYIEGESLRAALERHRPFTVREVVSILHDIVDALAVAHARGVIHRDIKPGNVLMQGSHALVTDFGVSKALNASLPITTTGTAAGIAIGTPAYMAPEQLAGDPAADHRMDIYAAGLVAYELLSGESPFTGPSPRETLAAQLTRDPKPLHERLASVPLSLSSIIMRCLAKDPANRPATAADVLHELDALTTPIAFTPSEGGVRARSTAAQRRRSGVFMAAGAAVFTAAVVTAFVVSSRRASPPAGPAATPAPPATPRADSASRKATPPVPVAAQAAKPKPVITRADSIAITAAIEKKIAQTRTRDSLAKAKIAEETQRHMMDSIIAANSGAAAVRGAPRRIVVTEPREMKGWPEIPLLGRAVADSLRRMLRARPRQYAVVDQDSVRAIIASQRNPDSAVRR